MTEIAACMTERQIEGRITASALMLATIAELKSKGVTETALKKLADYATDELRGWRQIQQERFPDREDDLNE